MKHLYYIRHGESELNVAKKNAGHTDTPLTRKGWSQAKNAGKSVNSKNIVIDVIICSPLQRTLHTAQEIAKQNNYPIDRIETYDQLIERNFGDLEAKNMTNDFGIDIDEYLNNPYAIDHIEDIEKIEDLQTRANLVLQYLKDRPENTVLVVGHGSFSRSLQRAIQNLSLHEPVTYMGNAEIVKLI